MNKDSIVLTKTTVVPFTEYVLPNGRKRPHPIVIEDEHGYYQAKVDAILKKGLVFEMEVLNTGVMSITVEDPTDIDGMTTCGHELVFIASALVSVVMDLIDAAYKTIQ